MKNTEIKYTNLSKDYNRLYELLHDEKNIAGYVSTGTDYSKIVNIVYVKNQGLYDFCTMSFFEEDFNKDAFIEMCESYNVRFFDISV